METPVISGQTQLRHRIMQLKAQKEEQEQAIKNHVKEIYYSLHLSTMIKRTFNTLKSDPELKTGAMSGALNLGASFLMDRIMLGGTKRGGIKRYLLNEGIKKLLSIFIAKKTAETV